MTPVTQIPTYGGSELPTLYFGGSGTSDPTGGQAGGGGRPSTKPKKKGGAKKTGAGKGKKRGAKR